MSINTKIAYITEELIPFLSIEKGTIEVQLREDTDNARIRIFEDRFLAYLQDELDVLKMYQIINPIIQEAIQITYKKPNISFELGYSMDTAGIKIFSKKNIEILKNLTNGLHYQTKVRSLSPDAGNYDNALNEIKEINSFIKNAGD